MDAFGPRNSPPSLDNPAAWYQLQVPSHDVAGEKRKGAPNFAVNLGRAAARKRSELLGIQERLVNPQRAGLEIFFLMDRLGHNDCFRFWGLSRCLPSVDLGVGYRQTTKTNACQSESRHQENEHNETNASFHEHSVTLTRFER